MFVNAPGSEFWMQSGSKRGLLASSWSRPAPLHKVVRPAICHPTQQSRCFGSRQCGHWPGRSQASGYGSGFGPPRPPVTTGGGGPHDVGPPRRGAQLLALLLLASALRARTAMAAPSPEAPVPSPEELLEATPADPYALGPPPARPAPPLSLGGASEGVDDDIETIRRLLRDAFKQQMHLSRRVRKLEPSSAPRDSLVDRFAARALKHRWHLLDEVYSVGSIKCSHLLEVAGGAATSAAHGLRSAAQLGPRLQSCIVGSGAGRGSVVVRTIAEASSLRLWQCQVRQAVRKVTLAIMPVGARFKEVAQPLHAGQGEGLLDTTREGCPAHATAHGAGIAARWEFSCCSLAAGLFQAADGSSGQHDRGSARDGGGAAASRPAVRGIAQLTGQVTRALSVALLCQQCVCRRERGHEGQHGVSVLSAAPSGGPVALAIPDFRVGCTAALDLDGAVLSGYCLGAGKRCCVGAHLAGYPSPDGHTWCVSAARSQVEEGGSAAGTLPGWIAEASYKVVHGDGLSLQPGLIAKLGQGAVQVGALCKLEYLC